MFHGTQYKCLNASSYAIKKPEHFDYTRSPLSILRDRRQACAFFVVSKELSMLIE